MRVVVLTSQLRRSCRVPGTVRGPSVADSWRRAGSLWIEVLTPQHHKEYPMWVFTPAFLLCSRNPERRLSAFHRAPGTGKSHSLQCTVTPSFLKPLGLSCLSLFFYLFYFYGLNLIICFPQAHSFDSLDTVLEIKNKYPKLTSPQGYVLASGWLGGKSQEFRRKTQILTKIHLAAC